MYGEGSKVHKLTVDNFDEEVL